MKKIFLLATILTGSVFGVQTISANDLIFNTVENMYDIGNYEGTYNGTMDQIMMNNKTYPDESASFGLKSGVLTCDFPQIGSMPGDIHINLKDVKVNTTSGEVSATPGSLAGTLNIAGTLPIKLYLTDLKDGKISINNDGKTEITFTLEVYGKFLGIINYPASVHFTGILE